MGQNEGTVILFHCTNVIMLTYQHVNVSCVASVGCKTCLKSSQHGPHWTLDCSHHVPGPLQHGIQVQWVWGPRTMLAHCMTQNAPQMLSAVHVWGQGRPCTARCSTPSAEETAALDLQYEAWCPVEGKNKQQQKCCSLAVSAFRFSSVTIRGD